MTEQQLVSLLGSLRSLPNETEWVEFKHNNQDPDMIGECITALLTLSPIFCLTLAYTPLIRRTKKETPIFRVNHSQ